MTSTTISTSEHVFILLQNLGVGNSVTRFRGNILWNARSKSISALKAVNCLIVDIVQSLVAFHSSDRDRDLKHQLESLQQTLRLTELATEAYEYTPLGRSLANIIDLEVERCLAVLQAWLDSIDRCRNGLQSTPISCLWRQVWWSSIELEVDSLASWKSILSTCQVLLGTYLKALYSVSWMDSRSDLQAGQISLRNIHSFSWPGSPLLHHIKLDTITVEDHLGRNIPVPTLFCSSWQAFHYIVSEYCRYGLGHELVERGDYFVSRVEDHQVISPSQFATTVKSGMVVEMGIVLREMTAFRDSKGRCPRCGYMNTTAIELYGWVECRRCAGQFQIVESDENDTIFSPALLMRGSNEDPRQDDHQETHFFRRIRLVCISTFTIQELISNLKVYKNLMLWLNGKLIQHRDVERSVLEDLEAQIQSMTKLDTIMSLVHSHQFRTQLMAVASKLACQDDPEFCKSVDEDDAYIFRMLKSVLNSDTYKEVILQLRGIDAERFLTLIYIVLIKQASLFDGDDQTSRHKAHRLVVRLSENCGNLPPSLSITGVTNCSKDPISGGGFADVFQALYQGELVALKCLRDFQTNEKRDRDRQKFCREALLWQDLKHPNILPFYGIDLETLFPRICMVSPWMAQGTLLAHIESLGGPKNANVDKYLLDAAQGLHYLHSRNIIHGDLRGNNIFIDDERRVRLADFGLSGWADATIAKGPTNPAGSLRWMAPELFDSEEWQKTFCSDVYAYACVCLEIYTGKQPFMDVLRDWTVIAWVMQEKRPNRPVVDMGRTFSNELWDLVEACWAQEPCRRPEMVDVVDIMRRIVPEIHN